MHQLFPLSALHSANECETQKGYVVCPRSQLESGRLGI